jgi:hypothetical protein
LVELGRWCFVGADNAVQTERRSPKRAGVAWLLRASLCVVGLLSLAQPALAESSVSPNPVAPGGTVFWEADAACAADIRATGLLTVEASVADVSSTPVSVNTSAANLTAQIPVPNEPGSYRIQVMTAVGVPTILFLCETPFVVASVGDVPTVDPRVGALAIAVLAVAVSALHQRRAKHDFGNRRSNTLG